MLDNHELQEGQEPEQPNQRDWRGYATIAGGVLGGIIAAYATIDYVGSLPTGPVVETISDLVRRYSIAGLTFLGFYGASAFLPGRPREEAAPRPPEEIERRIPREVLERLGEPQIVYHEELYRVAALVTELQTEPYRYTEEIVPLRPQP